MRKHSAKQTENYGLSSEHFPMLTWRKSPRSKEKERALESELGMLSFQSRERSDRRLR
jgi:hypothetical protein